jgi:hypothetical protein
MTIQNKLYQSQIRKLAVQQKEEAVEAVKEESPQNDNMDICKEKFSKEELAHFDSVEVNDEENIQ